MKTVKKAASNSVKNYMIKSNDFVSNDSPESSDDEKCNKNNNFTIMHYKIAHMIMFTQKIVQKII